MSCNKGEFLAYIWCDSQEIIGEKWDDFERKQWNNCKNKRKIGWSLLNNRRKRIYCIEINTF